MTNLKPSDHHEKLPPSFADLLQSRREAADMTLTAMASELEISRSQLMRLESGENKRPSPALLGRMIKRLDVKPEDLYALTGCIPPTDLPSFIPYLRAIHPDWPDDAITVLDDFHDFLRYKHSLR
jgi:transcriptional regulator with XRE-family HTH domain